MLPQELNVHIRSHASPMPALHSLHRREHGPSGITLRISVFSAGARLAENVLFFKKEHLYHLLLAFLF